MASAGMDEEKRMLRNFGLKENFQGDLSRETFHEITQTLLETSPPTKLAQLPNVFIRNISRLLNTARNVTAAKKQQVTSRRNFLDFMSYVRSDPIIHPLDVVVVVFLWCCHLVRQDLVKSMWDCRLAIPFAVERKGKLNVFLWPLQSLTMKWTANEETTEEPLARHPITRISAIKIGDETRISKSEVLNHIASEKQLPMFFHRGLPASSRTKSVFVDGMTEVAWKFRENEENADISSPTMLLNLRGNALNHPNAVQLLTELSDITIVFCHSDKLMSSKSIVEGLILKSSVIVLITDETCSGETTHKAKEFISSFPKFSEDILACMIALDKQTSAISEDLRDMLDKMQWPKPTGLQDTVQSMSLDVDLDEHEDSIAKGKMLAEGILDVLRTEEPELRKQKFVPLQGETWVKFAEAGREIYELQNRRNTPVDEYRDFKRSDMKYYRRYQFHSITKEGLSPTTKAILYHLSTLPTETKQIFRRYLKLRMEDMTREDLMPLVNEYNSTMAERNNPNRKSRSRNKKLETELQEKEERMQQISFTFEHIVREIGQIYEACNDMSPSSCPTTLRVCPLNANEEGCTSQSGTDESKVLSYTDLPSLGVDILLDGYSIDVLDGDAKAVPADWIEAIFKEFKRKVQRRNKDVKIHSISVIGIENSGKSTFLNALLGTQFSVGAGRCSRGVTLQVVRVAEKMRRNLGVDYVFVFDTEGLKSNDRLTEGAKFDNTIVIFAIGMSDTAILNLQGTNTSYLTETLPVAVEAFKTMQIAGIRPHCLVVHQGVDNTHASVLQQQNHKLERALEELVAKVEKLKGCHDVKGFKDVLKFDSSQDCVYVSHLYEGRLPMATVNTAYSDDTAAFGRSLLANIKAVKNKRDLTEFYQTVNSLWKTIQMEDFILRFRSSLESAACERRDDLMAILQGRLDDDLTKLRIRKREACVNKDVCTSLLQVARNEAWECFQQNKSDADIALNDFFDKLSRTYENLLLPKQKETMDLLESSFKKCLEKARHDIEDDIANKQREFEFHEAYHKVVKRTCADLTDLFRQRKVYDDTVQRLVEERWMETEENIRSVRSHRTENITECINSDAHLVLREVFERHASLIEKRLENKSKSDLCKLETFRVTEKHVVAKRVNLFSSNKHECENLVTEVRDEITGYVRQQEMGPYPYRKEMFAHILRVVKQSALERKEITVDLQVDLAIAAAQFAKETLKRIHLLFEKRTDPTALINKFKEHFKKQVETTITRESWTQRFSSEVSMLITYGLIRRGRFYFTQIFKQKIQMMERESCLGQKKSFLLDVLIQLVRAGNWNNIREYIQNTENFLKKMLENLMKTLVFSVDDGEVEETLSKVEVEIIRMCKDLNAAVEETHNEVMEDKRTTEVTSKRWLELFLDNPDTRTLVHSESGIDIVEWQIDFDLVAETIQSNLQGDIPREAVQQIRGTIQQIKDIVIHDRIEELRLRLLGCRYTCPFCEEICFREEDHQGDHEMLIHKLPLHGHMVTQSGVNLESKEVKALTCQDRVYGDQGFMPDISGQLLPYREYRRLRIAVNIRPDVSLDASCFWKWVLKKFHAEMERDIYSPRGYKRIAKCPRSWTKIKKANVITFLKKLWPVYDHSEQTS